ncbi:MAG: SOS response-associated peptidase [Oligoflexia bacterium]|nr:SOS response-associated peptidase [Oligoflexia bacterium]
MCGRFQIAAPFRVLVALYHLGPPPAGTPGLDPAGKPDPWLLPRLNIGPTQVAPVICGTGHVRYAVPMRWGFPVIWFKAAGKDPWSRSLINAKVEEAASKPTWSSSLRARRCL